MLRRPLFVLISVSLSACFTAVPEAQCVRDTDCDAGVCVNNACTSGTPGTGGGTGVGGGSATGGGSGGGDVGGGTGTGGGAASGGGTGVGGGSATGGGTGVGVDGGTCGCRDQLGGCQVGDSALACGAGGSRCVMCGRGEFCVNGACATGTCGPQTCAGCCTNGVCVAPSQLNAFTCGANGAACMQCPMGQQCVNGACAAVPCGPGNCSGCCTNGFCVPSNATNGFACGANGAMCTQCSQGQRCVNGACATPAACDATTCPTGCCQNGACVTAQQQSRFACGLAGQACQRCGMGQACTGGVCTGGFADGGVDGGFPRLDGGLPVADGGVVPAGTPCTQQGECQPPSTGACLVAATGYPGGYCTSQCGNGTVCSAGGVCITETLFGQMTQSCRASCSGVGTQSTCRTGYVCALSGLASVPGYCRPRCDSGGTLTGCAFGQACNMTTGLCQ